MEEAYFSHYRLIAIFYLRVELVRTRRMHRGEDAEDERDLWKNFSNDAKHHHLHSLRCRCPRAEIGDQTT